MFYKCFRQPHFAVISLIVSLPLMSENIYSPSLPDIARYLNVSESMVEYTMTVYLIGFAVGVLFWGILSGLIGRRASLIYGLILYLFGTVGCLQSESIEFLLLCRFIQALGGSTGSVLGMSILRDSWSGKALGAAFSKMSIVLAFALGIGPILGGTLTHYFGWRSNFQFLLFFGFFVLIVVSAFLPETRKKPPGGPLQWKVFFSGMGQIILDRKVLTFGLLVGGCNGILFSYFAEGPFLFIETLKQDPNIYGMLTFFVAIPWAIGGMVSSRLCKAGIEGERIILLGSLINLSGCLLFLGFTFSGFVSVHYGLRGILSVTIPLMVALTGIGMMIPNCLSQALDQYKNRSGSAASLFGFFYYLVIAALTYVMGTIHDGTVVPIPNQREDTFFMV